MAYLHSRRTDHFELSFSHRSVVNIISKSDHQPMCLDGVHDEGVVAEYGEFLEKAWEEYEKMGYPAPLNCSKDSPCRVYLKESFDYGRTGIAPRFDLSTSRVDYSRSKPAITVRNRQLLAGEFDYLPIIKATAAHELFHCIQFSYMARGGNIDEEGSNWWEGWKWWMEASATFMESIVFPELLVSHEYLYKWFDRPDLPLDWAEDGHPYGGSVFCTYLAQQFPQTDIVREVWEQASRKTALEALANVLGRHGQILASSTERDLFADGFAVANCLRPVEGSGHSGEILSRLGPKFQHAFARAIIRCLPFTQNLTMLDHLSSHYYYFVPPRDGSSAQFCIDTASDTKARCNIKANLLLVDADGACTRHSLVLASKGSAGHGVTATIDEFGAPRIAEAWLVVSNCATGREGDSSDYGLSVAPL